MSSKTIGKLEGMVETGDSQNHESGARHDAAVTLRGFGVNFRREDGNLVSVLRDIDLDIPAGQFIAIVGRSGCGKTTLLNALGALVQPTSGTIEVFGVAPSKARRFLGFMPARDALLPWRTAVRNVEYGLEIRGLSRAERRQTAKKYLDMVGLGDAANQWPWQLSQGMRQRVALARAWALEPRMLLMDEPFGALDAQTRDAVRDQFAELLKDGAQRTVVLVTHDLEEAVILADRILVLGRGGIVADMHAANRKERDSDGLLSSPESIEMLRELRALLR